MALSTMRLLFYYCGRADQDSGETNVSSQRASQDLGIRKDHVDEHDRKLIRERFIRITKDENGGRVVYLLSPWQPRAKRNGYPAQKIDKKVTSQDLGRVKEAASQVQGSPLDESPNLGQIPQNLGKSPQVLGEIPQNLGAHIRNNQLIEPEREASAVDDLADTLCTLYQIPDSAGWRLKDKFQSLAIELHGLGAKSPDVRNFYSSRQKKPGVEFFASDFVTWRASQNGGHVNGAGNSHQPPVVTAPADYRKPRHKGAE